METDRLSLWMHEPNLGASTDASLFIVNGVVKKVEDTSTRITEWPWDGWRDGFLDSLVGKTVKEVVEMADNYFNDFDENLKEEGYEPFLILSD